MPTFYFSGVNRPDLLSLLAEQQAAGMVNAAWACQPQVVAAYRRFPQVQLALDCNAIQRLRHGQQARARRITYRLEEALDTYARVIAEVGWRFEWVSSYDVIGDQRLTNWCYEQLLKRLAGMPSLASRVLWIYQHGSLDELKGMARRLKRVGIGGMVPILQRAGVSSFLDAITPIGQVLLEAGAQAHIYGVSDAQALASLASQQWFGSADGSTWLIAYRAMALLQASGERVKATRLGLRLTRRAIAANNIAVTQEWINPHSPHQFALLSERKQTLPRP
jgi:hypothetical protein